MKADVNFTLTKVSIINNFPEWVWNELLEAHAKNNWTDFFPEIQTRKRGC